MKKVDEVEKLRDALVELERARQKEIQQRKVAEAVLNGLNIVVDSSTQDELFGGFFKHLYNFVPFECASIFSFTEGNTEKFYKVFSSEEGLLHDDLEVSDFLVKKTQSTRTANIVQTSPSHGFEGLFKDSLSWNSALLKVIKLEERSYFLILLSKEKSWFNRDHVDVLDRLSPVLRQAFMKEEYTSKLIHSNQMKVLGEMAGGVAHEINTPLAALTLNISLMQKQVKNDNFASLEKTLNRCAFITDKIAKIVKGLRVATRGESEGVLEEISLQSVLEDSLGCCIEKCLSDGIDISIDATKELFERKIMAHYTQLVQVLVNLINNAYDEIKNQDSPWIKIKVSEEGEIIHIRVLDSGLGVTPDVAKKMFNPFYTTKPVGSGTGLGLSISQGLVEAMGGELLLDQKAKNTCFHLKLNLAS